MSALSPINTGAPALFRFARRFFKKIFGSRICSGRTNVYPQGGTLSRSCPAIFGTRQMAPHRAVLSRPTGTPSLRDEKKQQFTHGRIGVADTSTTVLSRYY
jgi:hypothetical protein